MTQGLKAGSALELLEYAVLLDAGRNDEGGGHTKALVREVDLLDGLGALELVNGKRVTVDAVPQGRRCRLRGNDKTMTWVGLGGILEVGQRRTWQGRCN